MIESTLGEMNIAWVYSVGRMRKASTLNQRLGIRILEDGSGWLRANGEWLPVKFYVDDILYRLDLQTKET